MCVFKYDKDKVKHKIAEKDITCYKVMLRYYYPGNLCGYKSLVYSGKPYFDGDEMIPDEHKTVAQLDKTKYVEGGVIYSYVKQGDAYEVYMAYNHIAPPLYQNVVMIKCVIPKGTPYWVSDNGKTYISMKLKIKGKVDMKVKIKGKVD